MLYGKAKRRQMARSLLPSTRRATAARDLAGLRRGGRRRIRQQLGGLTGEADPVAARWTDSAFDWRAWPEEEIKEAMWARRGHDKLGPFLRWAVEVTRHTEPEERLNALRRLLPPNTIGRHALQHAGFLDHFSGHRDLIPAPWRYEPRPEFERELRRVIAEGELGLFNSHMKRFLPRSPRGDEPEARARTLAGAHDLDAFLEDCLEVAYNVRHPPGTYSLMIRESPRMEPLEAWVALRTRDSRRPPPVWPALRRLPMYR